MLSIAGPFHRAVGLLAAALCCALSLATLGAALSGEQPSQEVSGEALAHAMGCGGCHAGLPEPDGVQDVAPAFGPGAPPLPSAFVFNYLEDPQPRRDGIAPLRMPDFGLDEGERLALALYLGADADADPPELRAARTRYPSVDARRGRVLFRALKCGGCHRNPDAPRVEPAPDLSREGTRVRPDWLRGWLEDPNPVRPSGSPPGSGSRMPDFRLTEAETDALVAYLMTRGAASGIGEGEAALEPLSPARARRAGRMLETRLGCLGCHRVGGSGGQIGPSLDGVAERLRPSFVRRIIRDPQAAAPGSHMPRQPLMDRDVDLLTRYLLGRPGSWTPAARRSLARGALPSRHVSAAGAEEPDGAWLYATYCAACHGDEGRGDGWNAENLPVTPTPHADSARMSLRPDDTLFDGIHAGGWVLDRSNRMPAFGGFLRSTEIRAVIAHIRHLCECQGPVWSRDGRRRGTG